MSISPVLRWALLADAVATAATGLLMLAASAPLESWLGLPAALLRTAGAALLPYAAAVGFMGSRTRLPQAAVWAVIVCNTLWAMDSILLLVTGWVAPTGLGYAFVIGQAVVVATLVEWQFVGLRESVARTRGPRQNVATV